MRDLGIMAIVGFLAFSEVASGFLQAWYAPLLKLLGQRLQADAAQLNWVNAAYLLSSVVCVPVLAKLGDRYGHKRVLVFALCAVAGGTVITAFATSFTVFLVGRIIQGALASILALEIAIIRERAGARAGKGIGILVSCLGAGSAIGTLLSGTLGTFLDITLVLLVPGVAIFVSLLLIMFTVPESEIRVEGSIDWKGAALLGAGLALVLFAISNGRSWGWLSPGILAMIFGGLIAIALFVRTEGKVKFPLIDIKLVTHGGVGFYLLLMLLFGAQFYGASAVNAIFVASNPAKVGYGFGLDSFGVSLVLLPLSVMLMVGAIIGDTVVRRLGRVPTLILANALVVVEYALLMLQSHSFPAFLSAQLIGGLGIGLFVSLMPAIIVGLAPADSSGIAGAMYNTSRTLSGAVGGALFAGIIASLFMPGTLIPAKEAFMVVWAICGGLSVIIIAILPFSRRFGSPRGDLPASAPETLVASLERT